MYKVNNVVDANKLISIISRLSVSSHDIDKLENKLSFRIGKKEKVIKALEKI